MDATNEALRELLNEKRVRLSWDADKRFLESYDQQYQVHGTLELWFKARLGRVGKAHYVEHFSHDNIHDLHSEALMTLSQVEDFCKNNDLTIPLEFDTIYDAVIADRPLRMANRDLKRYWPGWRDGQTMYERTSRDVLSWDWEIEILKALQKRRPKTCPYAALKMQPFKRQLLNDRESRKRVAFRLSRWGWR